jgi:glycerol uptake facilitator protein/aquaporin Z
MPHFRPDSIGAARVAWSDAARELLLMAILMLVTVTTIRFVFASSWPVPRSHPRVGLGIVGMVVGVTLIVLIRSPWGRKSGGHLNPAITVALWSMRVFPGRNVLPYLLAQGAGSLVGTALARLLLGAEVDQVHYGAVAPSPAWSAYAVFAAEAAGGVAFALLAGFFLTHPKRSRWLPLAVGLGVAAIIVGLGPLSGGAVNPARQLGPAVLSGADGFLWIYLVAPLVGAVIGATIHRRVLGRPLLTHRLCGIRK